VGGSAAPTPSALVNSIPPGEPVSVVTVNFESLDVSASVKAISLLSEVENSIASL